MWGTCVYFDEPKESNYIVLKPEFLTKDVMGKLSETNFLHNFKNRVLNHSDLEIFWPDYMDKTEMLISLIEELEIWFRLKEDEGKPFKDQRSVIVYFNDEREDKLHKACRSGKIEVVQKFLQKTNWQNHDSSRTSFLIACAFGFLDIVKLLLNDERVDINKANEDSRTPFYIACMTPLLNDDLNKTNSRNESPFYIACQQGHIEIVKLLLSDERIEKTQTHNNYWASFWMACYDGHLEVVKTLLNNERVHVKKTNARNESPFYIACKNGHIEIVELLLKEKQISIRKKTNEGKTAIDIAKEENYPNIVKLIQDFDTGNHSLNKL